MGGPHQPSSCGSVLSIKGIAHTDTYTVLWWMQHGGGLYIIDRWHPVARGSHWSTSGPDAKLLFHSLCCIV